MAYVAIVSTLIFGSIFVGVSGVLQTSEGLGNFDSAVEEEVSGDGITTNEAIDSDMDGLADVLEQTQYGTDPLDEDTDGDREMTVYFNDLSDTPTNTTSSIGG